MLIEIALIVLFTLFGLFIEKNYKVKKDVNERKIVPDLSPAELKYNYAGLINERDLTSIVIYLAYKKYIKTWYLFMSYVKNVIDDIINKITILYLYSPYSHK